jgi:hypothetical protein
MTSQENRKTLRRRVLKAGTIALNQGGVISCMVRNLSPLGACLEVVSPLGIPDEFILVSSDHIQRPCRIVWRSKKRIGVSFI